MARQTARPIRLRLIASRCDQQVVVGCSSRCRSVILSTERILARFDQKCGPSVISILIVLLDDLLDQRLQTSPITLLVALAEQSHMLLVNLCVLEQFDKVSLVLAHFEEQVHVFLVFLDALHDRPSL